MTVRLIGITKPVVDDIPGPAELLAYCARVSSAANQNNHETGAKLLRSLVRRKEWSPLEMVSLTIEIVTTRDIVRQILRHRSLSFQEFSQRYAVADDQPVLREARMQHPTDRQMSVTNDNVNLAAEWQAMQDQAYMYANGAYTWALRRGIAKEVARAVLPEGMTLSRLYAAGSLRSWLHYAWLRADEKTQKEHRLIAEQVREILCDRFPDLRDVIMGDEDKAAA